MKRIIIFFCYFFIGNAEEMTGDCRTMSREGEIKLSSCDLHRPFICEVAAKDAKSDVCGGTGFEFVESVGSCYKILANPYTWDDAYAECQAEAAHLVVLNSEEERVAVRSIIKKSPRVPGSFDVDYLIAGFKAEKPSRNFMTIFNQTLEEAGYSQWANNEPTNGNGNEYCGSLYTDGRLNDLSCYVKYGVICEKEIKYNVY